LTTMAGLISSTLIPYFMDFERRMGLPGLLLITGLECSVLPVPPEPFVFPYAMKMNPVVLAGLITLSSIAGSLLGYAIGYFGGRPVAIKLVGREKFEKVEEKLRRHDRAAWTAVFLAALITFIPMKPFTIGAGVVEMRLTHFLSAIVLGRFLRFLFIGYLARSHAMKAFIAHYFGTKTLKLLTSVPT